MITWENLENANKAMETVDISKGGKRKNYVMVNERVKAFRSICPSGSISTEIISIEDGVVTMMATIEDENGHLLATGMAQEKETSSFINKTSYIENCETSAVGRALGFIGIGIDASMASAEEVANAILNQEDMTKKVRVQYIDSTKIKVLKVRCKEAGITTESLCNDIDVESLDKITEEKFLEIAKNWEEIVNVIKG